MSERATVCASSGGLDITLERRCSASVSFGCTFSMNLSEPVIFCTSTCRRVSLAVGGPYLESMRSAMPWSFALVGKSLGVRPSRSSGMCVRAASIAFCGMEMPSVRRLRSRHM